MNGSFLRDAIVEARVLFLRQLLSSKYKPYFVCCVAFFFGDLCLDTTDGVCDFDFQGDCFHGERFDENLHHSSP